MNQSLVQSFVSTADEIGVNCRPEGDSVIFDNAYEYFVTYTALAEKLASQYETGEFDQFVESSQNFRSVTENNQYRTTVTKDIQPIDDFIPPPATSLKKKAEYPPPNPSQSPPPSGTLPEPSVNPAIIRNSVFWYPAESDWRMFQKWVQENLSAQQSPSIMNVAQLGWAKDPYLVATELMAAMSSSAGLSPELQQTISDLMKLCQDHRSSHSVFVKPGPGDDPGPPLITDQKSAVPSVKKSRKKKNDQPVLFPTEEDLQRKFAALLEDASK